MKNLSALYRAVMLSLCSVTMLVANAAPATANYFCDFEDDSESAQWITWPGSTASRMKHSTWRTGSAAFYTGEKGMYITDLDIPSDNTHSYPKTSGYTVSIYRKMTLEAGNYTISLDYKCPSELLSVSLIKADTLTAIQTQTGADYAPEVKAAIVAGLKDMKSAKWTHTSAVKEVTTAGTYLLTITYRTSTGPDLAFGAAVDNVEVIKEQTDPTACDYPITDYSIDIENNINVLLTWSGNADQYEVRVYSAEGVLIAADTVADEGILDSYRVAVESIPSEGPCTYMVRGLGCGGNNAYTGWGYLRRDIYAMMAVACPGITLDEDMIIDDEKYISMACGIERVLKPHVVAGGGVITGYRVDQVDYSECPFPFDLRLLPDSLRNQITTITEDDYWDTQYINLPFSVCFFNNTYNRALVGANGLVTFDASIQPHSRCSYMLEYEDDIPNRNFVYKNCIMGVFQDYYPVPGAGGLQQIWYGVLGEWPCRKMVVCFNEVPMYQNHEIINSSMIVMYEGTSVIDIYVKNRDLSPTHWQKNRGIIGIINADGTEGLAAPGRNTTDDDDNHRAWTAHNEAWRFSPIATPEYTVSWYKGAFSDPEYLTAAAQAHPEIVIDGTDSITVSNDIDAVTVRLQYALCNGDLIDILDYVRVSQLSLDVEVGNYPTNICQDIDDTDDFYVPVTSTLYLNGNAIDDSNELYGQTSLGYDLTFDEKGLAAGFTNQHGTLQIGEDVIELNPQNADVLKHARAGKYGVKLMFATNEECALTQEEDLRFMVHYPKSIVQESYGTLLAVYDAVAADYGFVEYQWYKNNEPIPGATSSYYNLLPNENIDENTTWQVAVKTADGEWIRSCPLGDISSNTFYSDIKDVIASESIPADFDGMMTVFDVLGRVIMSAPYDASALDAAIRANHTGIYLVHLSSASYQQTFRVLVK